MFVPGRNVTRAEFATLLVKSFGLFDEKAVASFSDVQSNAWYYRAVASAVKAGFVKGRTDGTFAPDESVSRADMAVMINNAGKALKLKPFTQTLKVVNKFVDDASIPAYAREAIDYTTALQIFKGHPGNFFSPTLKAVRAEAAVVVYKLFLMN